MRGKLLFTKVFPPHSAGLLFRPVTQLAGGVAEVAAEDSGEIKWVAEIKAAGDFFDVQRRVFEHETVDAGHPEVFKSVFGRNSEKFMGDTVPGADADIEPFFDGARGQGAG